MQIMNKLYIEAPCFGFGPISTSIVIAKFCEKKYDVVFITYGEALKFLIDSTDFSYIELDTRVESNFEQFDKLISKDDLIISNTNVELSTFLIENSFNLIVVDTLYWMWNSLPKTYCDYKRFIAQAYYGKSVSELSPKDVCKPIINYEMWRKTDEIDANAVLVSFGGMAEPGDNSYLIENALQMVEIISDYFKASGSEIYVVGGLFDKNVDYGVDKNVHIVGQLDKVKYRTLVDRCKYLFLSPGLTTIYEMAFAKRTFCLLPGLNVSQIYQVYQLNKECGYPYCVLWPSTEELVNKFSAIPELEGIDLLRNYLLEKSPQKTALFREILQSYKNCVDNCVDTIFTDNLYAIFENKAIEALIEKYV